MFSHFYPNIKCQLTILATLTVTAIKPEHFFQRYREWNVFTKQYCIRPTNRITYHKYL